MARKKKASRKRWLPKTFLQLKRYAGTMSVAALAKKLGRSENAVRNQASIQRLSLKSDPTGTKAAKKGQKARSKE